MNIKMVEDIIWTTEDDIRAEREQLKRWHEDDNTFWTYLRRYAANRRSNERSLSRYQHEFENLRIRGFARLTPQEIDRYIRIRDVLIPGSEARIKSWTAEVDRVVKEIYAIRDRIRTEEERLHRKKVKPVEEQWIADEECSGYDIYYRFADKKYIIRDEKKALMRVETKICLELTASIETAEGHDVPVAVEITCTTYVKEKDLSMLIQTEKAVESGLVEWLLAQGWGNLMKGFTKEGVAYNGEIHIETKAWYTWQVPDYPKVHVFVEKKEPRERSYEGEYKVED
jgi:hypothetical protein